MTKKYRGDIHHIINNTQSTSILWPSCFFPGASYHVNIQQNTNDGGRRRGTRQLRLASRKNHRLSRFLSGSKVLSKHELDRAWCHPPWGGAFLSSKFPNPWCFPWFQVTNYFLGRFQVNKQEFGQIPAENRWLWEFQFEMVWDPTNIGIWMFPKIGGKPPKWMVKIMENPIKMDDLGVPLFLETPIYCWANVCIIPKPECFGDFGGMGPLLFTTI